MPERMIHKSEIITPKYVFSKKRIEDCFFSMCKKMKGVTIYYAQYVDGLSFHISNNTQIDNFNCVLDRIETLIPFIKASFKILNIGGGYWLYRGSDEDAHDGSDPQAI